MAAPELYDTRFSAADRRTKDAVWRVLCEDFFQRWVSSDATVLDLGAGFCEFLNHIRCREKWAVDADERIASWAAPDVHVRCGPAQDLRWRAAETIDVVFASNVFEHFNAKDDVRTALREVRRVLRPRGRLLILQPNIRFTYKEYWDFFDHHLPLSDRAMIEALVSDGFTIEHVRPRFLPYTTKSRLPAWPVLVRLYLRCRPLQWLLGKQMFIVATKRP